MSTSMTFLSPFVFIGLPFVLGALIYFQRKDTAPSFRFSDQRFFSAIRPSLKIRLKTYLPYVRYPIVILFFLALARPVSILEESHVRQEGIDIVLAIDCSSSMLAEDFVINRRRQNRLAVVKPVVQDFVRDRDGDRIGIVAFARRAYMVCPLTLDYEWLITNLERVEVGLIEDGTAVGSAIASSLLRLKDSTAKSKVVILLSDGVNNAGRVDPLAAAEAAKALGIKIYTIGVGTKGLVPFPATDFWGRKRYRKIRIDVDEGLLAQIAADTGGQYFRATDTDTLRQIYKAIDLLEKTTVEEYGYRHYKELFYLFLIPALLVLVGEVIVRYTVVRTIP